MAHATHGSGAAHGGGHAGGHGGGLKPMYVVWFWLLVITLVEVFLAYIHVPIHVMLTALIGMAIGGLVAIPIIWSEVKLLFKL